ncbi:alpha-2 adrenergic receptor [Trichonephila clavipes]|nr:alpha-2 adrenergic receptor [Trichonephila clavipes]
MKIWNNGNLVLGPFNESTPCLMIVLMNCQTKLRINHLIAVKSVAILESNANLNFYTWKKNTLYNAFMLSSGITVNISFPPCKVQILGFKPDPKKSTYFGSEEQALGPLESCPPPPRCSGTRYASHCKEGND